MLTMMEDRRKIRGVEVVFPCKPYPSQFSFMDKVIQGLEKKQNCLLESPTGSGKSLALLCSALAWQTAEYNKKQQEEADLEASGSKECTCKQKTAMNDDIDFISGTEPTFCQAFLDSSVTITVIKGQIAHQQADVIVNTTSQTLQLNYGAVSQSLLCVGGSQLQKECNIKYPKGVQPGEVAVTTAGNLKCQCVYHGALSHWREPNSVQVLQTFIRTCLTTASDSGYSSISFPALGSGSLGYPKEVVVREMFGSVEQFARNNPQSSIKDVRFVVYGGDGETIKFYDHIHYESGICCVKNYNESNKFKTFEYKLKEKFEQNEMQKKLKKAGTPSKESTTTVIPESDEEDNDFKPTTKYRTPGQIDRKHQNISYDEPGPSGLNDSSECCKCGSGPTPRKVPKIYFGTRTHKQIAQIVRELKKTAYREARMTILASKEFACIHPAVSKVKNKNEGCKELMDGPGCKFNDKVKKVFPHYSSVQEYGLSEAWDLEDFVYLCKSKKACPYFSVRSFRKEADIIFCPYNYLIDPIIRQNMEINLKNDIIILDEAHNIEDAAREGASEHFTDDQLDKTFKEIHEMIVHQIKPVEHLRLKQMVEGFKKLIQDNADQLEQMNFEQAAKVWSGYDIVVRMKEYGIGPEHQDQLMKCFISICEEINEQQVKNIRGQTVKLSSGSLSTIERMFKTMDFLYRDNLKFTEDFRVAILKSRTYVTDTMTDDTWMSSRNKRGGNRTVAKNEITLHFWCMNPGVAFSDLHNTRCIVLTSGTLSPMNSFESELGTPFPIKLEANHVIEDKQVWVGAMSQGPTGKSLHAVYKNMETYDFQDELGKTVLKVCQEVPHGVLCFLPSYRALDKFTERWKGSGIYAQIARKKRIIMEPRRAGKEDFDELLKHFYDAVHGTLDEDDEEMSDEMTGALFLAVCRGKVSEGLDFADNFARAVITVGIPYPNWKDLQVAEKRVYNDKYRSSRGLLSGSEWYEIQAFRALNQALGRCIRHRKDWGLLILADERFVKQKDKYCKGLSKWVRNRVQSFTNCSQALESISNFTKQRIKDMPVVNPDTSFIPGTPITPGQGIVRSNVSITTPMTPMTPFRSNISPPNQDLSPETPMSVQTKEPLSKVPQPQFFTPEQNRTSQSVTQKKDTMQHVLVSPTEVKKSAALTAAAQAGTVIQAQPGQQKPLILPNIQPNIPATNTDQTTNTTARSNGAGQPTDSVNHQGSSHIGLVPMSDAAAVGNQQSVSSGFVSLLSGQPIATATTTPSSKSESGPTSRLQSSEKLKIQGKAKLNTLFKYCQIPKSKVQSADIVGGVTVEQKTNTCPVTPNLFDTQGSEFKVDSKTGTKIQSGEVDMDVGVSESTDKSIRTELDDDQILFKSECNDNKHDIVSNVKHGERSHDSRTHKKPIFRRHSVAPTSTCITIYGDSEDDGDFRDQSKSKRKSCDKKILSEIHQNTEEKVGDAKNIMDDTKNSDEENESEEILKTRRKSRGAKRKNQSNVRHAAKKPKGVEFLDNDDGDNGSLEKMIKCKKCDAILLSQKEGFEKRKRYPNFVKALTSQRFAEVIFLPQLDNRSSNIETVATKVDEDSDIILDSHLDMSTGSVIQYLCCSGCTKDVVGIQVLRKGDKSKDIEDNQVWIVSSLVDTSQS